MATKKPFKPFEKSLKNREVGRMGKEGTKREEAFDKKQVNRKK